MTVCVSLEEVCGVTVEYVGQEGDWQTEDADESVCHCQVDDQIIGDVVHAYVTPNGYHDEQVTDHANHEHDAVRKRVRRKNLIRMSDVQPAREVL